MADQSIDSIIKQLVAGATKKKYIFGAVFYLSSGDRTIDLISASGNINEDSHYYIASINKFFISAIILRLYSTNNLDLIDPISTYLPEELVQGLHVYKGRDYSADLSIYHMISLTSGLPCYLADPQPSGKKVMSELEAGMDQSWPTGKVIESVKGMKPLFPPGMEGRARYNDTGHRILGLVIERITGKPVNTALDNLFQELKLKNTYVCQDLHPGDFVPIRYKSEERHIPIFLSSTGDDIVSTAADQMIFLKAFFSGYFFPKQRLKELEKWHRIFFPFKYGIGIQKFSIPRFLSPFHKIPEMVGHCGSTGSVAFYIPARDLYITGTINQQARPNVAFQTLIKLVNRLKR